MVVVLICGDRNWNNFKLIDAFLSLLPLNTEIVEGKCRGADSISGYLAKKRRLIIHEEVAEWDALENSAGPIRNQKMLDKWHPNLVVAFHNDISKSKGTKDMITRAKRAKIPVLLISEP